jgi:hypothetical protein
MRHSWELTIARSQHIFANFCKHLETFELNLLTDFSVIFLTLLAHEYVRGELRTVGKKSKDLKSCETVYLAVTRKAQLPVSDERAFIVR